MTVPPTTPIRLRDADFSDLLLSMQARPGGNAFVRNLLGHPALVPIPPSLHEDSLRFHALFQESGILSAYAKTGATDHSFSYDGIDYRVAITEAEGGDWVVFARGNPNIQSLQQLGVPAPIADRLFALGRNARGLVLLVGATRSGKTTAARSYFCELLQRYPDVGITIEDPIEVRLADRYGEGLCIQTRARLVERGDGGLRSDFAGRLYEVLRRTPRYIFPSEIRDAATAIEVLRAGTNGHLVLSTLHANNLIAGLQRLHSWLVPSEGEQAGSLIAEGLLAVLHTQLVSGSAGRHLQLNWLFVDSDPIRARLRTANYAMLANDISQQRNQVFAALRPPNGGAGA